jgi:hypothetical protein
MKSFRSIRLSLLALALTGCAVGNQYDYQDADVALPIAGTGDLGVGVIDNRAYVLNSDKDPDFIGAQRGGYYNPFNVKTVRGQSLTEDMADSLGAALRNSGYEVTSLQVSSPDASIIASAIAENGKARNIVLTVTEWKTDIYMNMNLHYNLALQVISKHGSVLAANHSQGSEIIGGGGLEGQNARTATAAFETKIGRLFNSPEILASLKN